MIRNNAMAEEDLTIQTLRGLGRRLTPQRVMVLDAIGELGGHVTVDAIHRHVAEKYPFIDIATVYRTVTLLRRLHLLNEVALGDASGYEIADPHHRHHHMVCEHCGRTFHLAPHYLDALREQLIRDVGFEPHMEHFTISGLCSECGKDPEHSHSGHSHLREHGHSH
jgi:Fur family transcriptional regulator, ferric uptake regulator